MRGNYEGECKLLLKLDTQLIDERKSIYWELFRSFQHLVLLIMVSWKFILQLQFQSLSINL